MSNTNCPVCNNLLDGKKPEMKVEVHNTDTLITVHVDCVLDKLVYYPNEQIIATYVGDKTPEERVALEKI